MYVCMPGKACVHDMLVYWESKLIFQLSPGRGESVERLLLSCSQQPSSCVAHCVRTRSISLTEVKLHQWARPAWASVGSRQEEPGLWWGTEAHR